jgi:tripartite-type tricarboxylate transporter receptor subunit TctC
MQTPHFSRRHGLCLALGSLGLALGAAPAMAQSSWPGKPVRIIVNFAAGGATDILGRQLAVALSKALGQPVIVENKVGAGGTIGANLVAKAEPDGYTLLLTVPAPIAQAMVLYKELPYNPQTDLRMISDVAMPRVVCAVNPTVPALNAGELVAWAKANPGKLSTGSWGAGSQAQVIPAFLDKAYGTQTIHVAYRGESHAVTDLLGGQIMMLCGTASSLKPHIASGALRAIATVGATRSTALPNVPTFAESGMKDDVLQVTGPISLLTPAKTPQEIVDRLGQEVARIVKTSEMHQQIEGIGMEPLGNLPAEAAAGYNTRLPVLLKSLRDAGIKAE